MLTLRIKPSGANEHGAKIKRVDRHAQSETCNLLLFLIQALLFVGISSTANATSIPTVTEATYGESTKDISATNGCPTVKAGNRTSAFKSIVSKTCSKTSECVIPIKWEDYKPDPALGCYKSFGTKYTYN